MVQAGSSQAAVVSHVVSVHAVVDSAVVAAVSPSSWRLVCIRPGPVGQSVGFPAVGA